MSKDPELSVGCKNPAGGCLPGENADRFILSQKTVGECMDFARKINPNKEKLTFEKLRTFPRCDHYNEEEAANILQTIDQLIVIIFNAAAQLKPVNIAQQQTSLSEHAIPINENNIKNIAA